MFILLLLILLGGGPLLSQSSAGDYLVLKDGTKLYGKIEFLDGGTGFGTGVLFNDSLRLSFNDIDSIHYNGDSFIYLLQYQLQNEPGSKFKITLLKIIVNDSINIYTAIHEASSLRKKSGYEFFSTADNPLAKITYDNLSPILDRKPESGALLRKSKRCGVWGKRVLYAGAVTLLYGLVNSKLLKREPNLRTREYEYHTEFHPAVYVGLGVLFGSKLLSIQSHKHLRRAIDSYNGD